MGFISKLSGALKAAEKLQQTTVSSSTENQAKDEVSVFGLYSNQLDSDGVHGYDKFSKMKDFLNSYADGVLRNDIDGLQKYFDIAGSVYKRECDNKLKELKQIEDAESQPIKAEKAKLN